jgi:hypothetical protein
MKEKKELRDILPASGIWTVEDFANYMGLDPKKAIERLSEFGVKIFHFSKFYRYKIFRLEDLK